MTADRQDRLAPTVLHVAQHAGVSRQTVSNVLNTPDRVRPTTRERVQRSIDELGYRPHRMARNLRVRSTCTLGYHIQPTRAGGINTVLDRFLHALTDTARRHGYNVLLFTRGEGEPDDVAAFRELVATSAVDGFIVSETNYGDARVRYLLEQRVPFAVFGRTGIDAPHAWVDVDNAAGTRQAVDHLVAQGHERIAFLGWPEGSITGDQRYRGYRGGLADAGLEPAADHVARHPNDIAAGRQACATWLRRPEPPTAVVAVSDLLAAGVVQAAGEHGVAVGPRQLAVVGFDDTPVAPFLSPPLTSLRQPLEAAAEAVVAHATARIETPHRPTVGQLLAPQLVRRSSA